MKRLWWIAMLAALLWCSGCQYILPRAIHAGSTNVRKSEEVVRPAEDIQGDEWEIIIEPPEVRHDAGDEDHPRPVSRGCFR